MSMERLNAIIKALKCDSIGDGNYYHEFSPPSPVMGTKLYGTVSSKNIVTTRFIEIQFAASKVKDYKRGQWFMIFKNKIPEWRGRCYSIKIKDGCAIMLFDKLEKPNKRGGDMASKRSKILDQLYVSKVEFSRYDSKKKKAVGVCEKAVVLQFDKSYSYWMGTLSFKRLVRSAKRKKLSTIAYYQKYLQK